MTPRKLSNEELADLSDEWENATVDTSKYYQCVTWAHEVSREEYEQHKKDGGLCQRERNWNNQIVPNGRYYTAGWGQ